MIRISGIDPARRKVRSVTISIQISHKIPIVSPIHPLTIVVAYNIEATCNRMLLNKQTK